jgi:hypothetical protein
MRRVLFVLLTALLGSAAAPAAATPPERFKLEPIEFTIEAICDFDVEYAEARVHGNNLVFFDAEGDVTKAIIAGNFVTTLTNAATGASLTLNISGQFFITPNPDGSQTLVAHGRNLFFTVAPEPFLVFHGGRAVLTITFTEDSVELVLNEVSGKGFDVCEALAGPA